VPVLPTLPHLEILPMRRLSVTFLALGLAATPAAAAGDQKSAGSKAPGKGAAAKHGDAFGFPKAVELTDEQKAKLDELRKEFGPRLVEANARVTAILTPERHKVLAEARKKAVAEGKKGKEAQEAAIAALNLSADEQAKLQEALAARQQLMKEINRRKLELLTDKQKEQLRAAGKHKPAKAKG
jgi:hypothetical protein